MRTYEKNRDPYEGGQLHQICSKCQWWQSGHGLELSHCPLCGEAVDAFVGLLFGGAMIVFDGVRFFFHDRSGNQVVIDRADYPDVITFMLRQALIGPIVGNLGHLRPILLIFGEL